MMSDCPCCVCVVSEVEFPYALTDKLSLKLSMMSLGMAC